MKAAQKRKASPKGPARARKRRRAAVAPASSPAAQTPDAFLSQMVSTQLGVQQLSTAVADIVRNNWRALEKAEKNGGSYAPGIGMGGPKSWVIDPFDPMVRLGWKERRSDVTYDLLRRASQRLAIHQAFINKRLSQIAMFNQPAYMADGMGYDCVPKNRARSMTKGDKEESRRIEGIIAAGGVGEQDPDAPVKRTRWHQFVPMLMRDSFVIDQACHERCFNSYTGELEEFFPVDASTIRPAADTRPAWAKSTAPGLPAFDDVSYAEAADDGRPTRYVQVIHGQRLVAYSERQMGFAVRNPRTDIMVRGLGYSELEMAIGIITALLDTEKYQLSTFQQGSIPKGMFVFKGTDWSPEQMEALQRKWYATLRGGENAHQIPMIQYDGDFNFVHLSPSPKDMEFSAWNELLMCILCACLNIDPEELSLAARATSTQTALFEADSEWKIKASRDGGLKPILRFIAGDIAQPIVDLINPDFLFRIVGLDEPSEEVKHQRLLQEMSSFRSMNEVKVLKGGEPFDFSGMGELGKMLDIIVKLPQNPTTFAGVKMLMDFEAQKQQAEMQEQQLQQEAKQQAQQAKAPPGKGAPVAKAAPHDPVFWDFISKGEQQLRQLMPGKK